jgi:hypothetical protein
MADEPKTTDQLNDEEVVAEPDLPEEPEQEIELEEQSEEETTEDESAAQPEEPEERPPSRRETLRIQQILEKRAQNSQPSQPVNPMDYREALDADPETVRQLEEDRQRLGQYQYNQGLEQAKTIQFHTRLELDAPRVEEKYKFLDSRDRENFDPVRAEALNNLYLDAVGYNPGDLRRGIPESVANPSIRYADFVEAQMEFAEALMAEHKVRTTQNIAKQTAQTGLRPDGSSAKRLNLNQPMENMTDEELEAYGNKLGLNPSK